MKLLPFIFAGCVLLVGCGDSPVNVSVKTVERNGITYAISKDGTSNLPYTGSRSSFYGNGQLKEKKTFKRGTLEGPYIVYHENGQLRGKGAYKNGQRDGAWEWHDNNGRLFWRGSYKNGLKQ